MAAAVVVAAAESAASRATACFRTAERYVLSAVTMAGGGADDWNVTARKLTAKMIATAQKRSGGRVRF